MTAVKKESFFIDLICSKWADKVNLVESFASPEQSCLENDIVIADNLNPQELLEIVKKRRAYHIVQQGGLDYESEINTSAQMICDISKFLQSPIKSILDPSGEGRALLETNISFSRSSEKRETLQSLSDIMEKEIKSGALRTDIMGIADELVTNALFNAPFESEGHQGGVDRAVNVEMEEGRSGKLIFGFDDERVVVGCSDPFGSLNLGHLLEKVKSCYETGLADNMNMDGTKGAGIGSFVVFNLCSSYYVVVENGVTTLICCVLPKKMSSSKRAQLLKNVHCMVF